MPKTKKFPRTAEIHESSGQIDAVCEAFQLELEQGKHPSIKDYLTGWERPERSKLLCELLCLELRFRQQADQRVDEEEYFARFPDEHDAVEAAIRVVAESAVADRTVAVKGSDETVEFSSKLRNLRLRGKGGLGVVYVAEDERLRREAAVKFINERAMSSADGQERFNLEAEITSRLEHPGVVPVYGFGQTEDGQLFYAMRFIKGDTLEQAIRRYHKGREKGSTQDQRMRFHELLEQFVSVCKTIAYAHSRGILHRDIKPDNVMLGRYGETVVIDWGLALYVGRKGVFKESAEQSLRPGSGSQSSSGGDGAGTPAYMSPEQAKGQAELRPASDIYNLGATLYKLLTGELPFPGRRIADIKQSIIRGEFKRPRQVNPAVSKALEAICLKAMACEPEKRYATANDLALDVARYIADEPIDAYREPIDRRLARWARRNRTLSQSLLLGFILLGAGGLLLAAWQTRQAERERHLHSVAETARQNERELRRQGLLKTAQFAADAVGYDIDLRQRILEKEAMDANLVAKMKIVNAQPDNEESWQDVQEWLDECVDKRHGGTACRNWVVLARNGFQIARVPYDDPTTDERFKSIGGNFSYRSYFNGKLDDQPIGSSSKFTPLNHPKVSAALISSNDGVLSVEVSVPILEGGETEPLGVLSMSVEVGRIPALMRVRSTDSRHEPDVLLVDGRKYYMLTEDRKKRGERGEGLVLDHTRYHEIDRSSRKTLPRVDDHVLNYMKRVYADLAESETNSEDKDSKDKDSTSDDFFLPDDYRDPLATGSAPPGLAAFAGVKLPARQGTERVFQWFVIVQQHANPAAE